MAILIRYCYFGAFILIMKHFYCVLFIIYIFVEKCTMLLKHYPNEFALKSYSIYWVFVQIIIQKYILYESEEAKIKKTAI